MSNKVKNCLSCKYEPDWKDDGIFKAAGFCKMEMPYTCTAPYINKSITKRNFFKSCPAHQPKADEEE